MSDDPIIDEIRAIREQLAAKFDFDPQRMIADARRRQNLSGARVVSFQTHVTSTDENAKSELVEPKN